MADTTRQTRPLFMVAKSVRGYKREKSVYCTFFTCQDKEANVGKGRGYGGYVVPPCFHHGLFLAWTETWVQACLTDDGQVVTVFNRHTP